MQAEEGNFWARPFERRDALFAELRHRDRLTDDPLPRPAGTTVDARYWSVVRYEDVWSISRRPDVFASRFGTNIDDDPPEFAEMFGSMINMDDPLHARLRGIVAKGFGPRQIALIEAGVRDTAAEVVDRAIDQLGDDDGDFVEHFAAPLPLTIISRMMGIPEQDRPLLQSLTDRILGITEQPGDDPYESILTAGRRLYDYAQALAEERRRQAPREDITSVLMHAEVDGERLTAQEFGAFMVLLVVAGNETTRTAIAHGMDALTRFRNERQRWFTSFDDHARTAVDEIVRWSTPVLHFRRTATQDVVVRDTSVAAGDRLVLWYCSANRDETVFDDPHRFDVTRVPLPLHAGFGGGGPHFCLGANLARAEIRAMFEQIARRVPDLEVGPPELAGSDFVHGVTRMSCTLNRRDR